jgi:FKBP-type peptidyl-prolyl cis-trans isomerase
MKTLTIVLGALAILSFYFAWFQRDADRSSQLDKQGAVLGKEQADPAEVADIRVASWDDAASGAVEFRVQKKAGKWVIPTFFDYPADGGTRVGRTSGLLNVKRGRFVTDEAGRHEELGVVDPTNQQAAAGVKEHGKRVTLKDESGGVLIDLVIGKYDTDGGGGYFVREADSSEVYTAKVELDLSTKFIDWVEPDLLKLKREDIRSVTIRDYSVDEVKGAIEPRSETELVRATAAADWTSPQAPADKRVAKAGVDALLGEITGLRLVGIRPFRAEWLQQRGFFLSEAEALTTRKGAVVVQVGGGRSMAVIGNEGEMNVTTKDGLDYHLLFGEIALGDEEDKEADSKKKPAAAGDAAAPAAASATDAAGHNRYMVVFVSHDPALDEEAKAAAAAPAEPTKEGEPAKPKADPSAEHAKLAEKANRKFLAYFYVIGNATFENLRPAADKLFEAKPAEPMAGATGKTNAQWLEENGKKPGITTTASGLQYEVITRGAETGKQPVDSDTVRVHYKGTLIDGTEFDASKGEPAEFGVTGVIAGWTEALKLMRPGDKWRLFIPPGLGYGEAGSPPKIGANQILIFEVELVSVK